MLSQGKDNTTPHVVYLASPEARYARLSVKLYLPLRCLLIENFRRKHHNFYSSNTERDFSNNFITNDMKGSLAKDLVFLRKLENLLKEPEVSRRLTQGSVFRQTWFLLLSDHHLFICVAQEVGRFVRRHFALLSALFLAPLNRYLATLTTVAPDSKMIDIANFSEDDFLASLSKYGCQVQFKGKTSFNRHRAAESFYRKFCRSPGFFRWLQMKMRLQMADGEGSSGGGSSPASGFREKIENRPAQL